MLMLVGGKMVLESFRSSPDRQQGTDITKGLVLLTLSVATSLDALAVGLSFALLDVNMPLASGTIGAVAMAITVGGFIAGRKANKLVGRKAGLIGGLILVAIAFKILLGDIL